jgi:hypothetical protein
LLKDISFISASLASACDYFLNIIYVNSTFSRECGILFEDSKPPNLGDQILIYEGPGEEGIDCLHLIGSESEELALSTFPPGPCFSNNNVGNSERQRLLYASRLSPGTECFLLLDADVIFGEQCPAYLCPTGWGLEEWILVLVHGEDVEIELRTLHYYNIDQLTIISLKNLWFMASMTVILYDGRNLSIFMSRSTNKSLWLIHARLSFQFVLAVTDLYLSNTD